MTVSHEATRDVMATDFAAWEVSHGGCALVTGEGTAVSVGDLAERLPWASVTKIAAALAVLDVVHDGLLDLDDPAGPPGSTVRHLLAHASGYAFDDDRVLAVPGHRRIYSNTGIDVAVARAVTAAGASTAADLLQTRVFGPLGMDETTLDGPPAHGATGPLSDLIRLASELLSPKALRRGVHADLVTPTYPELGGVLPGYGRQDPNDWALGVELRGGKSPHWMPDQASASAFGHFGQSGSFLWVDPEKRVASVALTGTAFGPWAVASWASSSTRWLASWEREVTP